MPIIDKRLCNALIKEAEPRFAPTPVQTVLRMFNRFQGGLWVGGTVCLTEEALSFKPNAMNNVVHRGDYSTEIKLREVTTVKEKRGILTNIIEMTTPRQTFSIRCFRAAAFAAAIRDAVQAHSR